MMHLVTVAAASGSSVTSVAQSGLRSVAIALGGGLGAVGAGIGLRQSTRARGPGHACVAYSSPASRLS
jgi:hypothetical protein